jgi:hypothetical protein
MSFLPLGTRTTAISHATVGNSPRSPRSPLSLRIPVIASTVPTDRVQSPEWRLALTGDWEDHGKRAAGSVGRL